MDPIQIGQRLSILNRAITISADPQPVEGAAPDRYVIEVALPEGRTLQVELRFQAGAVGPDGSSINGISDEALLEILIHRLGSFQSGPWASDTNQTALDHLNSALSALEERSARRRATGVEGTTELMAGEAGHTG